ncbi:RICIN domain-containing protein [Xanthobacter autotrophicus]|uniref:RICIN domain-containing protein n=3 Tax=Xanthobacter autotrophicus TaxID=280 RepID=A0A6C1KBX3_XANAU|nr:RICIN domain-containing protein [Xanthobacter autotrophicus]
MRPCRSPYLEETHGGHSWLSRRKGTMLNWHGAFRCAASVCTIVICMAALIAPAGAAPPPSGRVQIANANSNLCLSPAGGTGNQNEQTVQYHCDTHPSRAWVIEPVEGNIVKIRNVNSNLCLTVAGGNSDRNTPSVQYSCDDHPSRRWLYAPFDGGLFRLVNVNSGLCLTIAGGSTGLNQTAVQFPCDEHPSRFFRLK